MAESRKRDEREEIEEMEDQEERPKKGGMIMKLVIALVFLVILGGGAVGGWMFYQEWSQEGAAVEEPVAQIGPLWPVGTLIVNLLDSEGERYLKITIELELSSADMIQELDALKPKILDGVLDMLSTKYYREIVGFEGRQQLRDEIAMRINNYLTKGHVTQVYFTEFVVQ